MRRPLAVAIALVPALARADSFWPMQDVAAIDHDVLSRWGEAPTWCGETAQHELGDRMASSQRVVTLGKRVALITTKGLWSYASDALVSDTHSVGIWRADHGKTLGVDISCTAPRVCLVTATLIIRSNDGTCIERWRTTADRGARPEAPEELRSQPVVAKPIDLYSNPHPKPPTGEPHGR